MSERREQILSMLQYFWEEYDNPERWTGFDRTEIAGEFPEVLKAWDDYKAARRVLDAVIRGVGE